MLYYIVYRIYCCMCAGGGEFPCTLMWFHYCGGLVNPDIVAGKIFELSTSTYNNLDIY